MAKKHTTNKNKPSRPHGRVARMAHLSHRSRSFMTAFVVVLVTAFGGGVYAILNSFADTQTVGNAYATVLTSTGGVLGGATIQIVGHHQADSAYGASWDSTTSCANGNNIGTYIGDATYTWTNCYVHTATKGVLQYYTVSSVSLNGWHVVGGAGPGTQFTIHTGQTTAIGQIYMAPNDTDGDGVPDYADDCPNTPGVRPTGCPAPSQGGSSGGGTTNPPVTSPPAVIQPSPGSQSGSGSSPKTSTGSGSRVVSKPKTTTTTSSAPAATKDTVAPSAPTDLQASEDSPGVVDLSWTASADNVGIVKYVVESSSDGENWTTLSDNVTDTSYSDNTVTFGTQYTYRVSSVDAAGNVSDYAEVDITTSDFSSNAYADQDSTINSDDGNVAVDIPAGALPEDSACSIDQNDNSLPKGSQLVSGPYQLTCKTKGGKAISKYGKPITFTISVSSSAAKSKPHLYTYQNKKWTKTGVKFNKNDKNFKFSTTEPTAIAVLGTKNVAWWKLLLGLFLMIGILLLGGWFMWYRRQFADYDDTDQYAAIGSVATAGGPPNPMVSPTIPQPQQQPLPSYHAPDQHRTIFSPAFNPNQNQQPQPSGNLPTAPNQSQKPAQPGQDNLQPPQHQEPR